MALIAHISDLHFGREIPERMAALKQTLDAVSPQTIVITGDLTQRATSIQYKACQTFLKTLSQPVLSVPGNHDMSLHWLHERFRHPWRKWKQYIHSSTEFEYSASNMQIIGLNTTKRIGHRLDWTRGRISNLHIQHVTNRTADLDQAVLRIVAMHHPCWLPPMYEHRKTAGNAGNALTELGSTGIDLILSGHVHAGFTTVENGVILCNCGSTVSRRLNPHQVNEFNLISGDRHRLEIKRMIWNNDEFHPDSSQVFRRNDRHWHPV